MKKSIDGATAHADGGKHGKTVETVGEILAELKVYCEEVLSGERKTADTFFMVRGEAVKLKKACDEGKLGDILAQLRSYQGEPSPAEFIARLEAAMERTQARLAAEAAAQEPANVNAPDDVQQPQQSLVPVASGEHTEDTAAESDVQNSAHGTVPAIKDNVHDAAKCEFRLMTVHELEQDDGRFMFETSKTHRNNLFTSLKNGYDEKYPMFAGELPDGRKLLYDGNTRFEEGVRAGLTEFPVLLRKFNSIEELRFAGVMVQIGRRNTSRRDQMRLIVELESVARAKARVHQGRRSDATSGSRDPEVPDSVHANQWLASMLDISEAMVKRLKRVIGSKYEEDYAKGEIGARKAYERILREEQATDNPDTNDKGESVTQAEPAAPVQVEQDNDNDKAPANTEAQMPTTMAEQAMLQPETGERTPPAVSDENVGFILVPIEFVRRAAISVDDAICREELLEILSGPDSEAGRIFAEAMEAIKATVGQRRQQSKKNPAKLLTFGKGNNGQSICANNVNKEGRMII